MTGAQLLALGHAAMARSHKLILARGVLGLLSIVAGLISRRIGAPVLLAFLPIGMLAGDEHVLGIPFDDFGAAYLIGSVALAIILFEGGVTAGILGAAVSLMDGVPIAAALLAGACAAPTDAAAVAVLLRRAGAALPERLLALLEVESDRISLLP